VHPITLPWDGDAFFLINDYEDMHTYHFLLSYMFNRTYTFINFLAIYATYTALLGPARLLFWGTNCYLHVYLGSTIIKQVRVYQFHLSSSMRGDFYPHVLISPSMRHSLRYSMPISMPVPMRDHMKRANEKCKK